MDLGEFVLHRFNGDERFKLATATMQAWPVETGVQLNFEVQTEEEPVATLPDMAELGAHPSAECSVTIPGASIGELLGRRFLVPKGVDEDWDWVGRLYYYEHDDLDENVVEIVAQEGSVFHVRWTASATDVNYYDGSKPRTRVEIDGWFVFREAEKWGLLKG